MFVSCHNNPTSIAIVDKLGFYISQYSNKPYLGLDFKHKTTFYSARQKGLLLYPSDLEVIYILPSIESIEEYIRQLHKEAAERFTEIRRY